MKSPHSEPRWVKTLPCDENYTLTLPKICCIHERCMTGSKEVCGGGERRGKAAALQN